MALGFVQASCEHLQRGFSPLMCKSFFFFTSCWIFPHHNLCQLSLDPSHTPEKSLALSL